MSIKHHSQVNKTLHFSFIAHTSFILFSDFRLTQCDRKFLLNIFFRIHVWKCIKLNARRKKVRERSNGVFNGIKNVNSQFQLLINFRCALGFCGIRSIHHAAANFLIYKKILRIDAVYGFGKRDGNFLKF